MPIGAARVRNTSMVCSWQASETKNTSLLFFDKRQQKVIASAAAVASSNSEALAMSIAVKSLTMVWKFNNASRRPWLISG